MKPYLTSELENDGAGLSPIHGVSESGAPVFTPLPLPPLTDQPLVSILVTSYNYAAFVALALQSLQAQTYAHWEAVVCDDGSTDGSLEILEHFAAADARIRVLPKPNGGQCSAINYGASYLKGQVVCYLDADDEFDSDKLAAVVNAFREHPDSGVCSHFMRAVDRDGRVIMARTPNCLNAGWLANTALSIGACVTVPVTSGMSFRAEVHRALMPIPSTLRTDADGYLFMAAQFLTPIHAMDRTLSTYRVHGRNLGGLIDFTVTRLRHEVRLIEARTRALREFLSLRFGVEVAQRLDIRANQQFVQTVLKLRALGDNAGTSSLGRTSSLIRRHPSRRWRAMWRVILSAPRELRAVMLPMASRAYGLKSAIGRWIGTSAAPASLSP